MFNIYRIKQNVYTKWNAILLLRNCTLTTRKSSSNSALNVNVNVIKDVILYKYDNPKFFKYLNVFALCQFGFWGYLSHFTFTTLRDAPVEKSQNTSWWRKINLGENKFRNTIAILCFLIGISSLQVVVCQCIYSKILGYGILSVSWMFTLRSVRYLILRKGGGEITIVTYTPFGRNRMLTVPLSDISCKQTRASAQSQLPIKVKKHYLHYVLDMKGEFRNTSLFDHTAGLRRNWS